MSFFAIPSRYRGFVVSAIGLLRTIDFEIMDLLDTRIHSLIGDEGFTRLVANFYKRIPTDDILGPMYGDHDLDGAETRLRDFLIQRFGGPDRYSQQRGHPRLRMRHAPFVIDQRARDRWIELMEAALADTALPPEAVVALRTFFSDAATFLINRP
jgi:hemoglobin